MASIAVTAGLFACNSAPAKAGPGPREPIVAPETREASKDLYGTQENYMKVMNQTDSEAAGTRAQEDINRRIPPREGGSK